MEVESRMVLAGGPAGGEKGTMFKGHRVVVLQDEKSAEDGQEQ